MTVLTVAVRTWTRRGALPLERQRVAIPCGLRVGCCEQNAGSSREREPAQLHGLLVRARHVVARGDRVRMNVDKSLHGRR